MKMIDSSGASLFTTNPDGTWTEIGKCEQLKMKLVTTNTANVPINNTSGQINTYGYTATPGTAGGGCIGSWFGSGGIQGSFDFDLNGLLLEDEEMEALIRDYYKTHGKKPTAETLAELDRIIEATRG